MIEDDSRVGRGFNGPGTTLRNLSNFRRYPEDVTGAIHTDGTILGGAFWDLRVATDLQTTRDLAHFAKYGTPDDADLGICYSEWFLEVLIADDDDGDLNNGTPHFNQIVDAFNNHGIGTSLFIRLSYAHEPLPNTLDTLNSYTADITFDVQGIADVDSVRLHFSTDNFQTVQFVDAVEVNAGSVCGRHPGAVRRIDC